MLLIKKILSAFVFLSLNIKLTWEKKPTKNDRRFGSRQRMKYFPKPEMNTETLSTKTNKSCCQEKFAVGNALKWRVFPDTEGEKKEELKEREERLVS